MKKCNMSMEETSKKYQTYSQIRQYKPSSLAWGFPDGLMVKNPPANAGDMGLIPDPVRSHMPQSN